MIKRISAIFIVLLLVLPTAFADGMIHVHDPETEIMPWRPHVENQQFAAINHEDGIQNMILAIDTGEFRGDKAVWIFPVPADGEEIEISIMKGFPQLNGKTVKSVKDDRVNATFALNFLSQIYTAPFFLFIVLLQTTGMKTMDTETTTRGMIQNITGLTIHEHIEEMGLASEVISGNDIGIIYSYLKINGFELPVTSKLLLDDYTGKGFSFVVVWINDMEEFNKLTYEAEQDPNNAYRERYYDKSNLLGVQVSFPREEIYFPLKPTSIYGETGIPIVIYTMSHVNPTIFEDIEDFTVTDYYFQNNYTVPKELEEFFNNKTKIENLEYTKISIDTQANNFTDDLWIENNAPAEIALADFIIENSLLLTILLFILLSMVSSALAGFIVFRNDKPQLGKFALFGLANLTTLIGFTLIAVRLKIDEKYSQAKKEKSKKMGLGTTIFEAMLIGAIIATIIIGLIVLSSDFYLLYSLDSILILGVIFGFIFTITAIFTTPFVWLYHNKGRITKFVIAFTATFTILNIILWIIISNII